MFLTNFLGGYYGGYTANDIAQYKAEISIDMNTNEVTLLPMSYPDDLWKSYNYSPAYSRIYANGMFVYLWRYYDYIYFTKDHNTYDSIKISSELFERFIPLPKRSDMIDVFKFLVECPSFYTFDYDKYRNLYFIFCYPGKKIEVGDDLENLARDPSRISIIILDENFNKVAEKILPHGKYLINNFFISQSGLYISKNYEANNDFNEETLNFDLYTVSH